MRANWLSCRVEGVSTDADGAGAARLDDARHQPHACGSGRCQAGARSEEAARGAVVCDKLDGRLLASGRLDPVSMTRPGRARMRWLSLAALVVRRRAPRRSVARPRTSRAGASGDSGRWSMAQRRSMSSPPEASRSASEAHPKAGHAVARAARDVAVVSRTGGAPGDAIGRAPSPAAPWRRSDASRGLSRFAEIAGLRANLEVRAERKPQQRHRHARAQRTRAALPPPRS